MEAEFLLFLDILHQSCDAEGDVQHTLRAEVLERFETLYARHGIEVLRGAKVRCNYHEWAVPLLGWVVLKNHQKLVQRLIDIGMSLEDGVQCDDAYFHNQTPLMLACRWSSTDMVALLLRAGANVLHTNEFGVGMLMVIQTPETCNLVIQHAIENNTFNELISQETQEKATAVDYANAGGHFDVFTQILMGENRMLFRAFELSEEAAIEQLHGVVARSETWCRSNDDAAQAEKPILLTRFIDSHYGDSVSETLLYHAAKKNYLKLVDRLLELNLSPIDDGMLCETVAPNTHKISPLGIACHRGHIEVMKRLIAKGADLSHVTHDRKNLLMLAGTVEAVEVLVHEMMQKVGFYKTFSPQYRPDIDIISFHCIQGHLDIVRTLLAVPNVFRVMSAPTISRYARYASIDFPEKSAGFDAICRELRSHRQNHLQLSLGNVSATSRVTSSYYGYHRLFGHRSDPEVSSFESRKTKAVKSVIARFYELLLKPDVCIRYLAFLNKELCRYYTEKHGEPFPESDEKTYHFVLIEGLSYPIPSPEYQPLKKHKALQELLIAVFRQYGMAEQAYQWVGFVPNDKADAQVKRGDFVFEGNYSNGLFHGKFSHMLQRVILIYAIEHEEIRMTFMHDRKRHTLLVQDVLEGLVSLNDEDGRHVWGQVKDTRMPHRIQFNDPHRLFSTLMCEGKSLGCAALADSLIDGFCKGLRRYYQAWTKHTPFTAIDIAEFLAQQEESNLAKFFAVPALIRAEMEETAQKRQLQPDTIQHSEQYAVIRKYYQPNEHFVPETCSDSSLGCESDDNAGPCVLGYNQGQ